MVASRWKIWLLIPLLLVLILISIVAYLALQSKWSAYLYASKDHGLNPEYLADFDSEQSCQQAAQSKLIGSKDFDSFLCGLNCYISAPFGSIFVTEIECEKKLISTATIVPTS